MARRSLWVALLAWVGANAFVLVDGGPLPFDWPDRAARPVPEHLLEVNLALVQVLALMVVVHLLTRRRRAPDLAARVPARALAIRETVLLLGYGVLGMAGGLVVARTFGWHPFGLHLAGTLYGTHAQVSVVEALCWAGYNLVVYAVLPLLYFRRHYSARALGLRSGAPRQDALLIVVVLVLESAFQILALAPATLDLPPGQMVRGVAVAFPLYLAGAVLPAMVFVYAILVPRFLALTGSATTTVLLGGLTYTALHVWDAWLVFSSPRTAALSVVFLVFTYLGPGMIKTYLTLRTGNAWVHVWAYHAFAPHTLVDTSHVVDLLHIE